MKQNNLYRIALSITLSTSAALANDDALLETLNARIDALEKENESTSDWTNKIKLKGDFRYRYEYKAKNSNTDKNRHRLRARIGAYASTNQTIDGYANKKQIWLDLAYMTYRPEQIDGMSITFGKMKQPWEQVSDLIFDTDVNPEGISASYETSFDKISLMSHVGYHIMDEQTVKDIALVSGQIAASTKLTERIKLTTGLGAFVFDNITGQRNLWIG